MCEPIKKMSTPFEELIDEFNIDSEHLLDAFMESAKVDNPRDIILEDDDIQVLLFNSMGLLILHIQVGDTNRGTRAINRNGIFKFHSWPNNGVTKIVASLIIRTPISNPDTLARISEIDQSPDGWPIGHPNESGDEYNYHSSLVRRLKSMYKNVRASLYVRWTDPITGFIRDDACSTLV
jgi:hypothetical protein